MIPTTSFSALTFIKIGIGLFIGSQDCICKVLKHLTNSAVSLEVLLDEPAEFLSKIIPPPALDQKGKSTFGRYAGGGIKECFTVLNQSALLKEVVG